MYKYVFFDLDGTITNPGVGITSAVSYALNKFGIDVADKTTLYPFIGPPLIDSFMRYYDFSEEKARKAVTYYREYYSVTGLYENTVYENIPTVLKQLSENGIFICLATSKPEEFAEKILKHYDLDKYFNLICGASMDETRTKKAEVIRYAIDKIKSLYDSSVNCDEIVMIGDREHDILGAKQTGLKSIGVLYGYGEEEELEAAGADNIISLPSEILNAVMCNEQAIFMYRS